MSMSISPCRKPARQLYSDNPKSSPYFEGAWGHWIGPHQCHGLSLRISNTSQTAWPPHPECTAPHFWHAFLLHLSGWGGSASDGECTMMLLVMTWASQRVSTTLQMQVSPLWLHCWCHFGVSAIISESGRSVYGGGVHSLLWSCKNTDYATVPATYKDLYICATHKGL